MVHEQQFLAVAGGDETADRFDLMIHAANECKLSAKYSYMTHLEEHGCSIQNEINNVEREKLTDTMLKVESARSSFGQVENSNVPNAEQIEECLRSAHESLKEALGYRGSKV
jgi:hypothetical protein